MSFNVSASAYDRFMGRFSRPLARVFADYVGAHPGLQALDVGCGPGALTEELVARLGSQAVVAVEPSETFVQAVRERLPDVDVRQAVAEQLPFPDGSFDLTLAQLVIHFMADAAHGLYEMARVTRPGGIVAASVWDMSPTGDGPLAPFWRAARSLDPDATDETERAGTGRGQLAAMLVAAGLQQVEAAKLTVRVDFSSFDDWWEPFTFGVGPSGGYVRSLDADQQAALRARCAQQLPDGPFTVDASAWTARGRA